MKITKKSRDLLLSMCIGDGSVSKAGVFSITHCNAQYEYLNWKRNLLIGAGFNPKNIKSFVQTSGYKPGLEYFYFRMKNPQTKLFRRVLYNNLGKKIISDKIIKRLGLLGLAIWYLDDGHINHKKSLGTTKSIYVKISTCIDKESASEIIDAIRKYYGVNFYTFSEGKKTYSLCCGTSEAVKFLDMIKPYVPECVHYKISYDLSGRKRRVEGSPSKEQTPNLGDDMI